MWSFRAWRRRRLLARHPLDDRLWQQVLDSLPILDGLSAQALHRLGERCILFLHAKRLTALPGVELDAFARLRLAAQAQLPLLELPELDWYQGFHELVLYPDDFLSPQRYRDTLFISSKGPSLQRKPILAPRSVSSMLATPSSTCAPAAPNTAA